MSKSFEKAFPSVAEIAITVEEEEKNNINKIVYDKNFPHEHPCIVESCFEGGVNLISMVRKMVLGKHPHFKETKRCKGYIGSPKGRVKYGNCHRFFSVSISITYKP